MVATLTSSVVSITSAGRIRNEIESLRGANTVTEVETIPFGQGTVEVIVVTS